MGEILNLLCRFIVPFLVIPEVPVDVIREAVINSFAHARYDIAVQHEIDIFSDRILIINPGSFASDFAPEDYSRQNLPSSLRNEVIANTLYRCKDVETFGSGLRKIYTLCAAQGVTVHYENHEMDFELGFSRLDRNIMPSGRINGRINGTITDAEAEILNILKKNADITTSQLAEQIGKSVRTANRLLSALKGKGLIERIGSNKTGYWRTK